MSLFARQHRSSAVAGSVEHIHPISVGLIPQQRPSASWLKCPCSTDSLASSLTSTNRQLPSIFSLAWIEPVAGHTSPANNKHSFLIVAATVSTRKWVWHSVLSYVGRSKGDALRLPKAQAHPDQTPEPHTATGHTDQSCSLSVGRLPNLFAPVPVPVPVPFPMAFANLRAARRRLTVSLRTGPLPLRA